MILREGDFFQVSVPNTVPTSFQLTTSSPSTSMGTVAAWISRETGNLYPYLEDGLLGLGYVVSNYVDRWKVP